MLTRKYSEEEVGKIIAYEYEAMKRIYDSMFGEVDYTRDATDYEPGEEVKVPVRHIPDYPQGYQGEEEHDCKLSHDDGCAVCDQMGE